MESTVLENIAEMGSYTNNSNASSGNKNNNNQSNGSNNNYNYPPMTSINYGYNNATHSVASSSTSSLNLRKVPSVGVNNNYYNPNGNNNNNPQQFTQQQLFNENYNINAIHNRVLSQQQQQSIMMMHPNSSLPPNGMMVPPSTSQLPIMEINSPQQYFSTPWALGSTDGTFATSLILYQEQLLAQTSGENNNNNNNNIVRNNNGNVPDASNNNTTTNKSNIIKPVPIPAGENPAQATSSVDGSDAANSQSKPITVSAEASQKLAILAQKRSIHQDLIFRQPSASVEAVLAAACEVMAFDIAEMWLRTGAKTHQLTNSHLRPTSLQDSVRKDLVDVYYGAKSSERTHRLSPALCKRAKEANDVVWVTAHTPHGAEALRCSISNVRTAVAIPACHEASNTNITIIFFSIRRILVRPAAVEFLVHLALAAGAASVNSLGEEGLLDRDAREKARNAPTTSQSEHAPNAATDIDGGKKNEDSIAIRHQRVERVSITGARLDLQWRQLHNVEYLTDGGNSWIHTAVYNAKPVVVKTLKPECQDVAVAINEIEGELSIHSRLNHNNICALIGAGTTSKGVRFAVLERLDGGTLTQMMGYDTRIRDRRRRFWRRKQFSFLDVLRIARSIADAMSYCHEKAIPGCIVLHRDLKPDNIGFTLDGTVKILDFGLARIIENASVSSDDVYHMSGETGSLRYMAPEVADGLPYHWGADVYSFGIILWEINATKKPFDGLDREMFYERVVHGGERPALNRKWPKDLTALMQECWDADMHNRPRFHQIVARLDALLDKEKGGAPNAKKNFLPKISGMIDRHSTWF